jgi:hypothetical protein
MIGVVMGAAAGRAIAITIVIADQNSGPLLTMQSVTNTRL